MASLDEIASVLGMGKNNKQLNARYGKVVSVSDDTAVVNIGGVNITCDLFCTASANDIALVLTLQDGKCAAIGAK